MPVKKSRSSTIRVIGARENNLLNVSLALPHRQLIAIAGVSGAGKSTLAHHIIAQVARRRLGRLRGAPWALAPAYEPCIEALEGLPACIELPQEPLHGQSRSTVATYTGLLDLLATLLLHHGIARSPGGDEVVSAKNVDLAAWLWRHHKGKNVTVARIRPGVNVISVNRLPTGTFYFRERRTNWTKGTRTSVRLATPACWWLAAPEETIKLRTLADAENIVRTEPEHWLWSIENDVFLEAGAHRIAADDPLPYKPLTRSLFSFNTDGPDGGQCPSCIGLGALQGIAENALIRSTSIPVIEGGLNLPQSNGRFTHLGVLDDILRGLFYKGGVPANVSWNDLPVELRRIVMYGSGTDYIAELPNGDKRPRVAKRSFVGIIPLVLARARSSGPAAKVFQSLVAENACSECHGSRFNRSARASQWHNHHLADLFSQKSLGELRALFGAQGHQTHGNEVDLLRSIESLLIAYERLNLAHLPLNRATSTLSGGEAQRLKLGLGLALEMRDTCYVIDEPSRGLHALDLAGLAVMLRSLVSKQNTVLLVEHQPPLIQHADHLVLLGPGGGAAGGQIIYEGIPVKAPMEQNSMMQIPTANLEPRKFIEISRLTLNNVRDAQFRLPVGQLTAVVGVSGAGKSSAILQALIPAARSILEGGGDSLHCHVRLPAEIRFVSIVGQKLASRNRRSIVATVVELLDPLRAHFAGQSDARALGLHAADFSFNSNGACSACSGSGFAHDGFGQEMELRCHVCNGTRLAGPALLIRSAGYGLAELLDAPIASLLENSHPALGTFEREILATLVDLGLGHLSLGRATPTLSAGERQRLALVRFLARLEQSQGTGLLVLDEPTAGLSPIDARRVFERLRILTCERKHTVLVIEHKLAMLPFADWVLEFGPGGGPAGGRVIFEDMPSKLCHANTPTASAWNTHSRHLVEQSTSNKIVRAKNTPASWGRCADIFEQLATKLETHDEGDLVRPIRPAVRLDPRRLPDDTRLGELLELLPWARKHGKPQMPKCTQSLTNQAELDEAVRGRAFMFSPVAAQLRQGLVTPDDLKNAVRSLLKLGFHQAVLEEKQFPLHDLFMQVSAPANLFICGIICPSDASEQLRATALRWSQGVVTILDGPNSGCWLTTQFISSNRDMIGLPLNAPYIGDSRSPLGRCVQCLGSGLLPAYPWDMIVANERLNIDDDKFWHPAMLKGIRSLRQSRLLPEAVFFAKQWIADFLQPPIQMNARTRFLFEHGIPWRHFPKPSSCRIDRVQDYYSWRGLHDYVYLALGQIIDEEYKQSLKNGYRKLCCPVCKGTGMGWEASVLYIGTRSLRDWWSKATLLEWHMKLLCDVPALKTALELGLQTLGADDRFGELSAPQQESLLIALASTAPLDGVALVTPSSIARRMDARRIVSRLGMALIPASD
jgi:excinuclease ABC A subunit